MAADPAKARGEGSSYAGISAADNARQHNGDVYNNIYNGKHAPSFDALGKSTLRNDCREQTCTLYSTEAAIP